MDMFAGLKNEGYVNQGAFHMGDNIFVNNISYYKDVDYVFRNKYNKFYMEEYKNVYFAALGMKSGFGPIPESTLLPSSQRTYHVNFIGSLRNNRKLLISKIHKSNLTSFLYSNFTYGSKKALHIITYRNILKESMFTLAPWGTNPESMRLYEAMEAGSIPVFQKVVPYMSPMSPMGENPIPQFEKWDQAIGFMENMVKNLTLVDELQKRIMKFWREYKERTQSLFKEVIDDAFYRSYGYFC